MCLTKIIEFNSLCHEANFVAVMIWLFAFSSIIGNYYYGETNVRYIKDTKLCVFVYRLAVAAMVMTGAVVSLFLFPHHHIGFAKVFSIYVLSSPARATLSWPPILLHSPSRNGRCL